MRHPRVAAPRWDFVRTDGQTICESRQSPEANPEVKVAPAWAELKFVGVSKLFDANETWTKLGKEIYIKPPRRPDFRRDNKTMQTPAGCARSPASEPRKEHAIGRSNGTADGRSRSRPQ